MAMTYNPWVGQILFPGSEVIPEETGPPVADIGLQEIPLDNTPNHTFDIMLDVDGETRGFRFTMRYNTIAEYWVMTVIDPVANVFLLDSIPLLTGDFPAGNLLRQHGHLEIGCATVVKSGSPKLTDYPDDTTLGTDFILLWGNTQHG
jgi:hypothetical protein